MIESLRKKIDRVDRQLLKLLTRRQALAKQIARHKKRSGLPLADRGREKLLLQKLKRQAKKAGLSPSFIARLFREILQESRQAQRETKK